MSDFYYVDPSDDDGNNFISNSSKMTLSNKGLAFTAGLEGIGLTKYLDSVNVQTIGIGSTASDIPDLSSWAWDKKISIGEAFELYRNHMEKYIRAVQKALKVKVEQSQFDALVSICYNIGVGGLAKSTFIKRINNKESLSSIRQAILMWDKPKEIIKRRTKEADLFCKGVYAGDGKVLVFPIVNKKPRYSGGHEINAFDYL